MADQSSFQEAFNSNSGKLKKYPIALPGGLSKFDSPGNIFCNLHMPLWNSISAFLCCKKKGRSELRPLTSTLHVQDENHLRLASADFWLSLGGLLWSKLLTE